MRKQTAKVIQSEKNLPSLNKLRALTNAGRKLTDKRLDPISLSPRAQNSGKPYAFEHSPTTIRASQVTQRLQNKLQNLKQIIENQTSKIDVLEYECLQVNPNFKVRSFNHIVSATGSPKNEEETLNHLESLVAYEEVNENLPKDEVSRNKFKDLEIFKLRRKIDKEFSIIEKLKMDHEKCMKKLEQYEDALEQTDNNEVEISSIKLACNSEVHRIFTEINEKEIEISEKTEEIQELSNLLTKSEEKRCYNNEYNIFIESTSEKLRARMQNLIEKKERIQKKILIVQTKIQDKEIQIEKLSSFIKEAQDELDLEKQKNLNLFLEYEAGKEAIESNVNQHEIDRMAFKDDIEKLESKLVDSSMDSSMSEKKHKEKIMKDKHLYSSLHKKKHLKRRDKLTALEKKIDEAKYELEKLKKNEIYLKNQLLTKDLIIAQIEKLLQRKEEGLNEGVEKVKIENRKNFSDIHEMIGIIRPWIARFDRLMESMACVNCKVSLKGEYVVINTCGHLVCAKCKDKLEGKCLKCESEISGCIESDSLHILISSIKIELDFLKKTSRFLDQLRS